MGSWEDLLSQVLMSGLFAIAMIFLSSRLPMIFKDRVNERLNRELKKQGPISTLLARELTMMCADFSGSVGAILGLSLSILFEIWKLHPMNPSLVSGILVLGSIAAIFGTAKVLLLPWADRSEQDYQRGLGKSLARIVYILSAGLVCVAAVGPAVQLIEESIAAPAEEQASASGSGG